MSDLYGCVHYDGKGLTGLCGACAADLRARLAAAEAFAAVAINRAMKAERVVEVAREMVKVARLDPMAADEYVDALRAALAQVEEPAPRCEHDLIDSAVVCQECGQVLDGPACQGTGRGA